MNNHQIQLIKEASASVKDCSFHLQDAANELQRIIDTLLDVVNFDNELEEERL